MCVQWELNEEDSAGRLLICLCVCVSPDMKCLFELLQYGNRDGDDGLQMTETPPKYSKLQEKSLKLLAVSHSIWRRCFCLCVSTLSLTGLKIELKDSRLLKVAWRNQEVQFE